MAPSHRNPRRVSRASIASNERRHRQMSQQRRQLQVQMHNSNREGTAANLDIVIDDGDTIMLDDEVDITSLNTFRRYNDMTSSVLTFLFSASLLF